MSWVLEKRNKRTEDGVKLIASRDTAETIRSGARRTPVYLRFFGLGKPRLILGIVHFRLQMNVNLITLQVGRQKKTASDYMHLSDLKSTIFLGASNFADLGKPGKPDIRVASCSYRTTLPRGSSRRLKLPPHENE